MTVRQSLVIITAISLLILPAATACNNTESSSPSYPTWPVPDSSWGEQDPITVVKYSSNSSQYFIDNEAIKYSYQELNQAITGNTGIKRLTGNVTTDVKEPCLQQILEYIYAFPGYEYASIKGEIGSNNHGNVEIVIRTRGLKSEFIAKSIHGYGESYVFEFQPAGNGNYNMVDFIFCKDLNYVVPREVYENAIILAKEHPVVQKFILDHDLSPAVIYFNAWFDALKVIATPNTGFIDVSIDFRQPIRGIISLNMHSGSYYDLRIYVDIYSGEVFTMGPSYIRPI